MVYKTVKVLSVGAAEGPNEEIKRRERRVRREGKKMVGRERLVPEDESDDS